MIGLPPSTPRPLVVTGRQYRQSIKPPPPPPPSGGLAPARSSITVPDETKLLTYLLSLVIGSQ